MWLIAHWLPLCCLCNTWFMCGSPRHPQDIEILWRGSTRYMFVQVNRWRLSIPRSHNKDVRTGGRVLWQHATRFRWKHYHCTWNWFFYYYFFSSTRYHTSRFFPPQVSSHMETCLSPPATGPGHVWQVMSLSGRCWGDLGWSVTAEGGLVHQDTMLHRQMECRAPRICFNIIMNLNADVHEYI